MPTFFILMIFLIFWPNTYCMYVKKFSQNKNLLPIFSVNKFGIWAVLLLNFLHLATPVQTSDNKEKLKRFFFR